jgi:hypothetical protein
VVATWSGRVLPVHALERGGGQAAGNAVHLAKAGHEVHARAGDGPEGEVWYGLRAHGPAW